MLEGHSSYKKVKRRIGKMGVMLFPIDMRLRKSYDTKIVLNLPLPLFHVHTSYI